MLVRLRKEKLKLSYENENGKKCVIENISDLYDAIVKDLEKVIDCGVK